MIEFNNSKNKVQMSKYSPERMLRNIIPDIRDNVGGKNRTKVVEKDHVSMEELRPIVERFLPSEIESLLRMKTKAFELETTAAS